MNWLAQQLSLHAVLSISLQVVQSMAWPATVVILAVLFRVELRQVLGRLAHLKYRDFEAEFRDELNRAEALPPSQTAGSNGSKVQLELNADAPKGLEPPQPILSARDLVRRSWSNLEAAMGGKTPQTLLGSGAMDVSGLVQSERLRGLAKLVDRHPEWQPPREEAIRYRGIASRLVSRLERAAV